MSVLIYKGISFMSIKIWWAHPPLLGFYQNLGKRGRRSKAFEAIFARYRYARMDGTESLLF